MVQMVAREGQRLLSTEELYLGDDCSGDSIDPNYISTHFVHLNDRGQAVLQPLVRTTTTPVNDVTQCRRTGALSVNESGQLNSIFGVSLAARPLNNNGEILGVALAGSAPGTTASGVTLFKFRIPACGADYNGNGRADVSDLQAFVDAWLAHNGDFNHDGNTTLQDLFSFLDAWFGGC